MNIEINRPLFYKVADAAAVRDHERYNIGTYNEKKLHIIMKHYFEPNNDYHELPYNGYICDIKRENRITEIETSGLFGKKDKLASFLPDCHVNLVCPVPHIRYVAWMDPETGEISKKRRSPKKETVYSVLYELVYILPHVTDPNLTVTAVLLEVDDYRMLDGWSRDRKRGSHRFERMPTDICEIVEFKTNADYAAYLPPMTDGEFTAAEFGRAIGMKGRSIYGILKVFEARGLIVKAGKRGRAVTYTMHSEGRAEKAEGAET